MQPFTDDMGGWKKGGENIEYKRSKLNQIIKDLDLPKPRREYQQLSFAYTFPNAEEDTTYFSYCYPYTFTKLHRLLDELRPLKTILNETFLCRTLGGIEVPLLTVTSRVNKDNLHDILPEEFVNDSYLKFNPPFKRIVIVIGRVHPGESNSSYVMEGFLRFITGQSLEAKELRKKFIFKVIPMINPDGVIAGNYRASISGSDLNR